jgi:ELWxxDGT repeat protein
MDDRADGAGAHRVTISESTVIAGVDFGALTVLESDRVELLDEGSSREFTTLVTVPENSHQARYRFELMRQDEQTGIYVVTDTSAWSTLSIPVGGQTTRVPISHSFFLPDNGLYRVRTKVDNIAQGDAAVALDLGDLETAVASVVDPQGRTIVAVYRQVTGEGRQSDAGYLIRLDAQGQLDPSFGIGGRALISGRKPDALRQLDSGEFLVVSSDEHSISVLRVSPEGLSSDAEMRPQFTLLGKAAVIDTWIGADGMTWIMASDTTPGGIARHRLLSVFPDGSLGQQQQLQANIEIDEQSHPFTPTSISVDGLGEVYIAGSVRVSSHESTLATIRIDSQQAVTEIDLVADINLIGVGSEPNQITEVNGVVYFTADNGLHGRELWRINEDGVAEIFADINPGPASSIPRYLTNVSGTLYFSANDGTNGLELWRINSVTGQAEMVEDSVPGGGINPGSANSGPSNLTNVSGILYFTASDGTNGTELWKINNATGLAEMVEDAVPGGGINPGSASSIPRDLTNVNGTLYFSASDGTNGYELWRINSVTGLAEMVEDAIPGGGINPGSASSFPSNLTNVNGTLFFRATDGTNGFELWRINSVTGLVEMVEDAVPGGGINPGSASSYPSYLTNVNGMLYFSADDGTNGRELWRINSVTGLAEMVEDAVLGGGINPGSANSGPGNLTNVNGTLYFRADDGSNGSELWRINSVTGLAEMIEDAVTSGGINPGMANSSPGNLTNVDGTLYFSATDGTNGQELWRINSEGLAEMVEDAFPDGGINPGPASSIPRYLTNVNGTLYFRATDGTNGQELWRINSVTGLAEMIEDAVPGGGIKPGSAGSNPSYLTDVDSTLYFQANDGTNGQELWRINSVTGLAKMVEDAVPGGGIRPGLYSSTPRYLTNVNGTLYFSATDGTNGFELWRISSEGLAEMVEDAIPGGGINPGLANSSPSNLTNVDGTLYFSANDGTNGNELWRINSVTGLAEMVEDAIPGGGINPGSANSSPSNLANVSGTLYFSAGDSTNGRELWRINSVTGLAEMVEDAIPGGGIRPGLYSSTPRYLTNVNGTLYFSATDGTNGRELWRINSEGLAEMVEDAIPGGGINPGLANSSPSNLTNVDGTLYFTANDGTNGNELWRINSVTGLAEMVEDTIPGGGIRPGPASSYPSYLTNVNGTLYFSANDGTNGFELWRINSVTGLAEMIEDAVPGGGINPGSASSNPSFLTNLNGTLYFSANDGTNGVELWQINEQGRAELVRDIHPGIGSSLPEHLTAIGDRLFFSTDSPEHGRELWGHVTRQVQHVSVLDSSANMAWNERDSQIAFDSSGRMLLAYQSTVDGLPVWQLLRRLPNGDIDTGFGTQGVATLELDAVLSGAAGAGARLTDLQLTTDGGLVLAGYSVTASGLQFRPLIARWTNTGQLSQSFGSEGILHWNQLLDQPLNSLSIDSDDRLTLSAADSRFNRGGSDRDALVIRLLTDGSPDYGFGSQTSAVNFEDVRNVRVLPVAPNFKLDQLPEMVEQVQWSYSLPFSDPGDDSWQALVDYGDGTVVTYSAPLLADRTVPLEHTYARDGIYQITISVTDLDDQLTRTVSRLVQVAPAAPILGRLDGFGDGLDSPTLMDFGKQDPPDIIDEGSVWTSSWQIQDGLDRHRIEVDFGDGSPTVYPTVYPIDPSNGLTGFDLAHRYEKDGVYTVIVRVFDLDDQLWAAPQTVTVNVVNVSPSIITDDSGEFISVSTPVDPSTELPGPMAEDSPILFSASFFDPSNDSITIEWDLDYDGLQFQSDQTGAEVLHAFPNNTSSRAQFAATALRSEQEQLLAAPNSQFGETLAIGGNLYIVFDDGIHGTELWEVDSSTGLARLIETADSVPGTPGVGGINEQPGQGSHPQSLTDVDGRLFFTADDGANGRRLWMLTLQGTALPVPTGNDPVVDPWSPIEPGSLTQSMNQLFFVGPDAGGTAQLWRVAYTGDGSPYITAVMPSSTIDLSYADPSDLVSTTDALYFTARGMNAQAQDATGIELWSVDPSGEARLVNRAGATGIRNSDQGSLPRLLTPMGNLLYFTADDGIHGRELWTIDESGLAVRIEVAGGTPVTRPATDDAGFAALTAYMDTLYFVADDGNSGSQLWRINPDGLAELAPVSGSDPNSGLNPAGDAWPQGLTLARDGLYFTAEDGVNGRGLWRVNRMGSIEPVTTDASATPLLLDTASPARLTSVAGRLFFVAPESIDRDVLWHIDSEGHAAAVQMSDQYSSVFTAAPSLDAESNLFDVGGYLAFETQDDSSGYRLWKVNRDDQIEPIRVIDQGGQSASPWVGTQRPDLRIGFGQSLYFTAALGGTTPESDRLTLWRLNQPDSYRVAVRAFDGTDYSEISFVNVQLQNNDPVIDWSMADLTINEAETFQFFGPSLVSDSPGDRLYFEWTLRSTDGTLLTTSTSETFNFVPPSVGSYELTLLAYDDEPDGRTHGGIDPSRRRGETTSTVELTVQNILPTFELVRVSPDEPSQIITDRSTDQGTLVQFSAANLFDPGVIDGSQWSYQWSVVGLNSPFQQQGQSDSIQFTPTAAGTYLVSLMVDDGNADGFVTQQTELVVRNVAPEFSEIRVQNWLAFGDGAEEIPSIPSNVPVRFSGTYQDPGGVGLGLHTGTAVIGSTLPLNLVDGAFDFEYNFPGPGVYSVQFRIRDQHGAVANQQITVNLTGPDQQSPVVTLDSDPNDPSAWFVNLLNGTQFVVDTGEPWMSGTVSDDLDEDPIVEIMIGDRLMLAQNLGDGRWQLPQACFAEGPLTSGIHDLRVRARDAAGNESATGQDMSLIVVLHEPTGVVLSAEPVTSDGQVQATDRLFGQLATLDEDLYDQFLYELVEGTGDADNARFRIVHDEIFLRAGELLDHSEQSIYSVRVRTTDLAGNSHEEVVELEVLESEVTASSVVGSFVYYRGSQLASSGIEAAIDNVKVLAKEGSQAQTLDYSNLINTSRGITGLVFDIDQLPGNLTIDDFLFQMSPQGAFNQQDHNPADWESAPAPSNVSVLPGTTSRVVIEWPDNAIVNRWLRVTIKANSQTGLANPEVYYLGHLLGETTGPSNDVYTVTFADITALRAAIGQSVDAASPLDIDKSGLINFADISAMRANVGAQLTNITIPPAQS